MVYIVLGTCVGEIRRVFDTEEAALKYAEELGDSYVVSWTVSKEAGE